MEKQALRQPFHVAIIGGGITGLAAAWYLQQAEGADLSYSLLEASGRWGGKIVTDHVENLGEQPFVVEGGPDAFLTQKPWALQLARELGLEEQLLPTNDHQRQVFVLKGGRPVPLPDGVMLIVPTKIMPFVRSPLISPLGKLRMGLELLIPARRDGEDETLADFIRRRLGAEALDSMAEPLMAGIYNAEPERQSLLATFPRFRAIEEQHGSLIRGMLAARKERDQVRNKVRSNRFSGRPETTKVVTTNPEQQPVSAFLSLREGMEQLVEALRARLEGYCRLNTTVTAIEREDNGRYRLALEDGQSLMADAVILAVPAYVADGLLRPFAPEAAAWLGRIRYVSTGTISLAFRRAEVEHPLNGFGLVIPRSENRNINALTWTSTKFDQRAPDGTILLRAFFGGSRRPDMMAVSDDELLRVVRGELESILGIEAEPLFHRIYRWHDANPQYDVGHLSRVQAIEAALPAGLYVTGSAYRGVGIPDCVHQAQETVGRVVGLRREQTVSLFYDER